MRIYIPTYRRVGRQITWSALPAAWRSRALVVCPTKEVAQHEHWSRVPAANLVAQPDHITTIAQKRQWILEHAASAGERSLLMLDDDLGFHAREHAHLWTPSSLRRSFATEARVDRALRWLEHQLEAEGYAHGGLGSRQGNNQRDAVELNTRAMHALGLRPAEALEAGANFAEMAFREDFHVTLQLLSKGLANIVLHDVVVHPGDFGAEGGCSDERTMEASNVAADALAARWQKLVRVTEKEYRASIPRKEVVIQWKKAYTNPPKTEADARAAHAHYVAFP